VGGGGNLSHLKDLIAKCNYVILLLDQLEDDRDLRRPKFNFRNIVKVHLKRCSSFSQIIGKADAL
jgi:hypothetical protein